MQEVEAPFIPNIPVQCSFNNSFEWVELVGRTSSRPCTDDVQNQMEVLPAERVGGSICLYEVPSLDMIFN